MRLVQFIKPSGERAVGLVKDNDTIQPLNSVNSIYELSQLALHSGQKLEQQIETLLVEKYENYQAIISEQRILSPIDHQDSAHVLVSGTGLTHLGSADTRSAMHTKLQSNKDSLTDSMKMFRMGVEGGKPEEGEQGVQPEWFYKGDGSIIVAPEGTLQSPSFALDAGEEPEIAGIYIIGENKIPYRLGFCLGNEFSDHQTEKKNYLYLAHSKLRQCSIGPELLLGDLPANIKGTSKIIRNNKVVWEKEFLSGEDNMSHAISNLEYHHFKYEAFLRPGDIHIHFFGTGTLSFGDGFKTQEGDTFKIESEIFGKPLHNSFEIPDSKNTIIKTL